MTSPLIRLNTAAPAAPEASILVIYTGGTFGMVSDRKGGALHPFDFSQILERLPELRRLRYEIAVLPLPTLLDSSNMKPGVWVELARMITDQYDDFDSFVILHGTDTMAYTASALSFLLRNLSKPVLLTGAQLPIEAARTDAKENFMTALEIAAARDEAARPMVPEVCIYFNSLLLRGNRAKKVESSQFNAFRSDNYPALAEAGVFIEWNRPYIRPIEDGASLHLHEALDTNVLILKLFPGISETVLRATLQIPGLRGVVLETFGAGNAPTDDWFLACLAEATQRGLILLNVSQCPGGRVTQGQYQTSTALLDLGVVSGSDLTTEAAVTKLMVLLGESGDSGWVKKKLAEPLCGEMAEGLVF